MLPCGGLRLCCITEAAVALAPSKAAVCPARRVESLHVLRRVESIHALRHDVGRHALAEVLHVALGEAERRVARQVVGKHEREHAAVAAVELLGDVLWVPAKKIINKKFSKIKNKKTD